VGEVFGLPRERVRQIEKRALLRLATAFRHGDAALSPRKRRGSRVASSR
jgi:DNA-directed RNA polymerase sigma subunit (sigma70/sigma32)